MTYTTWRDRLEPVARAALASLPPTATDKDKRRALRGAWPLGPRKYWPYRVWLDVCAKLLHRQKGRIPQRSKRARQAQAVGKQNLSLPFT